MKSLLPLFLLLLLACGRSERVYYAADFGIEPNTEINVTPLVIRALDSIKAENRDGGAVRFVFSHGTYNFHPEGGLLREYYISNHDQDNPKTMGIVLEDMKNFTLDGDSSNFLFHGRMLPISLINSESCTLRNFSVDFPNPHISQVTILSNDTAKGEIIYRIASWVKYRIEDGKFVAYGDGWEYTPHIGIAFEGETKRLVYRTSDIGVGTTNVEEIEPRVIKAPWNNRRLIAGTVVAMRGWGRPTPGIFMSHDKNTKLQNINIHYAEGMGLLAQMSEGIDLEGFSVRLRGDTDPRYFTTQADATHFSACKGLIRSVGGLYEGMMDDAINVHGTYLKIVKRLDGQNVIARYMHPQAYGFEWGRVGDAVQFVNSRTMELIDTTNYITAILPYDKETIEGAKEYKITFAQPIDSAINERGVFGIENLEWTPEVVFAENRVRNNRARGTLFSTPKRTVVENNIFDHTSGTAILLCGDCNGWFETGACRNVLIRGNKFINSLTNMFQFTNAVISIYPEIPNLEGQKKYFHSGIVIEDNLFETFDKPILYAKSVDGLIFRNNTIVKNSDYPPFHWNKAQFLLERVQNFVYEGNSYEGGTSLEMRD